LILLAPELIFMPKRLTCPQGHHWEPPAIAATANGSASHCPVCGSEGEASAEADSDITLVAPSPSLRALDPHMTLPGSLCGAMPGVAEEPFPELPTVAGYEVHGELGRGGMGVVYKARQEGLNRTVALKMVLTGNLAGTKHLARFKAEAEAVARLHHPNIVQIYEVGEQDGRPYFSLEYVDGGSLAKMLSGTPLPLRSAAELVEIIARAIHFAHQKNIIHRDLKPANILLASTGRHMSSGKDSDSWVTEQGMRTTELGLPKITDFGLAKQLEADSALSNSGAVVGTPSYMAPEQAGGKGTEVGVTADVYSLGAILYELLTGRAPFRGETPLDTMLQVLSEEVVPPSKLHPRLPQDLETICLKCLEKEPRRRYASALELADELTRFLNDEPIRARPISQIARTVRWCRRNPALAAVSSVAGLAVLIAFGLIVGFAIVQSSLNDKLSKEKQLTELALQEVEARRQELERTDRKRREFERLSATLALDQGLSLCEQGEVSRGLLWLARSLEIAPAEAADLQRVIRYNLSRWGEQQHVLRDFLEHEGPVQAVAFSADGKTVLTGSMDKTARFWDAATGKAIGPVLKHPEMVTAVAFGPDGRSVITGCGDKKARLWDATSGSPIGEAMEHKANITAVAFSPKNNRVATASFDQTAQLWDAKTGLAIGPALEHGDFVMAVAFNLEGRLLATGSFDKMARIWDVASGKPVGDPLVHRDSVMAVAFSPDGKKLVTGTSDRQAQQWELAKRDVPEQTFPHRERVRAVAYSLDGKTILTGSDDRMARLWEADSGRRIGVPLLHRGAVTSVAFHPYAPTVLTGSYDKTARLWDAVMGRGGSLALKHKLAVTDIVFSPDGTLLLTGSYDNSAQQWLVGNGRAQGQGLMEDTGVTAVAYSPDGQTILTGMESGHIAFWEAATGQRQVVVRAHDKPVSAVAFSPNGRFVASRGWDQTARLWDAVAGQPLFALGELNHKVTGVAFSIDSKTVATACGDGRVRFYNVATGEATSQVLLHPDSVTALAFSPDGKLLATGCQDKLARLWDLAKGEPIGPPLEHQGTVLRVAFGPDGHFIATSSEDTTARVWEVRTGRPVGTALPHPNAVGALAFSPDGKVLATGSSEVATLWQLPAAATGDAERVVRSLQLSTGMELDPRGNIRELDAAAWRRLQQRPFLVQIIEDDMD